ncbi:hypothetical protein E2C01_029473 [Portunus trituberculatus]|uniref:Uncharacterized protein n=1 Tax=Portunus trituberculatus TaxID=210409 RepID=A0A5B7ESB7_PORTR|nr:hypothetical protein [Portunus trituberculatus]
MLRVLSHNGKIIYECSSKLSCPEQPQPTRPSRRWCVPRRPAQTPVCYPGLSLLDSIRHTCI